MAVPFRFRGLETIGIIFFLFNILLFILNVIFISLRFYTYPETFKASFMHPSERLFMPAGTSPRIFEVFHSPFRACIQLQDVLREQKAHFPRFSHLWCSMLDADSEITTSRGVVRDNLNQHITIWVVENRPLAESWCPGSILVRCYASSHLFGRDIFADVSRILNLQAMLT